MNQKMINYAVLVLGVFHITYLFYVRNIWDVSPFLSRVIIAIILVGLASALTMRFTVFHGLFAILIALFFPLNLFSEATEHFFPFPTMTLFILFVIILLVILERDFRYFAGILPLPLLFLLPFVWVLFATLYFILLKDKWGFIAIPLLIFGVFLSLVPWIYILIIFIHFVIAFLGHNLKRVPLVYNVEH